MNAASCNEKNRVTIHVIVTCSNQMSHPIPMRLQLGQVPGRSATQRVRKWITRLSRTNSVAKIPARDLFAGEHWSVARRFPALHRPGEVVAMVGMLGGLRLDSR